MRQINIGDFPIGKEEREAINRVLDSGRISEGKEVRAFEEEYADWLGVKYCVATSSGTAALMCGLTALKYDDRFPRIKDGCKILIPALTFIATANAIKLCGMEPAFGDVHLDTFALNANYIDDSYAAVMPVHLFGFPADMDTINRRARRADAVVAEDACESHGSLYKGQKTGTFSLWSAFSFYIAHTLQAGEMGIVATDDKEVHGLVKRVKAHGRQCHCNQCFRSQGKCPYLSQGYDPRYHHVMPGFNFKTMEFQAALARLQLERIDDNIAQRRKNVYLLNRLLGGCIGKLILPAENSDIAYMMYPLILHRCGTEARSKMLMYLTGHGVECRAMFGSIPTQQPAYAYASKKYRDALPISDFVGANGLLVGCHQYLGEEDIHHVAKTIKDGLEELGL